MEKIECERHVGDHTHEHFAEVCGHETLRHEDHTDFEHDGHWHAKHGDHWDDHEKTDTPSTRTTLEVVSQAASRAL